MKKISKDFADNIITNQDILKTLDKIQALKELIFENPTIPLLKKIKEFKEENLISFTKNLTKSFFSKTKEEQVKILEEIEQYLLSLPKIRLTFAFQPSYEFLQDLSQWLKEQTSQTVVLDVMVRPQIIGGLIIEYKGKYRDFSLIKKIHQHFSL